MNSIYNIVINIIDEINNYKLKYYFIYTFIICQNIYAVDLYVSKHSAVDSTSFRTIQAAVNASEPGDNIFIREGRYSEHVKIVKSKPRRRRQYE